jgi:hypothetical protein
VDIDDRLGSLPMLDPTELPPYRFVRSGWIVP